MSWSSVEAVCDCPGRLESWRAFVSSNDGLSRREAERQVKEAAREHIENNRRCNRQSMTVKAYYEWVLQI